MRVDPGCHLLQHTTTTSSTTRRSAGAQSSRRQSPAIARSELGPSRRGNNSVTYGFLLPKTLCSSPPSCIYYSSCPLPSLFSLPTMPAESKRPVNNYSLDCSTANYYFGGGGNEDDVRPEPQRRTRALSVATSRACTVTRTVATRRISPVTTSRASASPVSASPKPTKGIRSRPTLTST